MASTKQLNELTSEELLEIILNSPPEELERQPEDKYLLFLEVFGIKNGEHPISTRLLYNLFEIWSGLEPTQKKFTSEVKKFIVHKREYFYVDKSALKINAELYELINKKKKNKHKLDGYRLIFTQFCKEYELVDGKTFTNIKDLYSMYKKWAQLNGVKQAFSSSTFKEMCLFYFKINRNKEEVAISMKANSETKDKT